ncbi:hypothetical protein GRR95_00010, partial [Glaesserella parasuis]|nr:hypothetical protein [Glaesserella parasuis]
MNRGLRVICCLNINTKLTSMKTAQLYRYSLPVETGIILRNRRLKQR